MPRLARNELEGKQFIHVMVQGINKETIFLTEREKLEYIKLLNQYKNEYHITIIAYCVMNNHVHVLVHVKDIEDLTKYMHKINTSYGIYFNKNRRRVGYVYRDRFKTQVINDEKHLYNCIIYIHNNPVKANICEKANEYRYSSCYHNAFYTDTELERNIKNNMYVQEFELSEEQNFILMEEGLDKEEICNEIIKEIMIKNHRTKEEIRQNDELIGLIIKKLKSENDISYRMLESVLGINRKRLKKIEEKQVIGKTYGERIEDE